MAKYTCFFLVDDDADDVSIFKEILREVNPSIALVSAADGQEALKFLKHQQDNYPDVIFLDLNMPRMNGKECLSELKKDPHQPRQKPHHLLPVDRY